MRLDSILLRPFRLALRHPLRTAQGTLLEREGWAIAVSDGEGHWGLGEAAPLPGFAMETHAQCADRLRQWEAWLAGRSVDEPALREGGLSALGADLPIDSAPAASHGIELALLDLAAQRAREPLARWLAPDAVPRVAVNATLGVQSPADTALLAEEFVAEGFETLKIKVGADPLAADLARLRAVREAVGQAPRLRIDANGAWTRDEARRALEAMAEFGIEYAEQPVAAGSLEDMAWLVRHAPVPVAADESACSPEQARRVLETHAADVLVLKPMSLGGLMPTLDVVRRASKHDVGCVITTTIDGAVARTGALHAAAAAMGFLREPHLACGLATGAWLAEDLSDDAPVPHRGALSWPKANGLGLNATHVRPFQGAGIA